MKIPNLKFNSGASKTNSGGINQNLGGGTKQRDASKENKMASLVKNPNDSENTNSGVVDKRDRYQKKRDAVFAKHDARQETRLKKKSDREAELTKASSGLARRRTENRAKAHLSTLTNPTEISEYKQKMTNFRDTGDARNEKVTQVAGGIDGSANIAGPRKEKTPSFDNMGDGYKPASSVASDNSQTTGNAPVAVTKPRRELNINKAKGLGRGSGLGMNIGSKNANLLAKNSQNPAETTKEFDASQAETDKLLATVDPKEQPKKMNDNGYQKADGTYNNTAYASAVGKDFMDNTAGGRLIKGGVRRISDMFSGEDPNKKFSMKNYQQGG